MSQKTLGALLRDKAKLKAVLLHHVAARRIAASRVVTLPSAKTLSGKRLQIRVSGSNVSVNTAKVTKPGVMASNGVIHSSTAC